ncbi:MAG: aldo/keto reductase [Egibacteraceae bacterium]
MDEHARVTDSELDVRPLGETGLSVSPIGLGLAALGRPGYINVGHAEDLNGDYDVERMEEHTHQILDEAYAAGVRYLDAARSYGRAEAFLSSWLHRNGHEPNALTVGSKWGYEYTANWQVDAETHEVKEHSLAMLRRQHAESWGHLGWHLRLYQVHSATLDSGLLDDAAVLDGLARLGAEGTVIGLSLSGPGQAETLKRARTVERDGRPLFQSVQATWNLLEPSCGPALAEARADGLGVIVKEAVANGRLTSREDPERAQRRALLDELADELETTPDAVALAATLAQPWADVVLSGAADIEHLRSNLRARKVDLNDETLARLGELAEEREEYWVTRSALPWT